MNTTFDHCAMNHMITAVSHEMSPPSRRPRPECDTLFIGGPVPSDRDQYQLAQFGLSKNWKIVYPSFDPADPLRGPLTYHVVVTDGLTETIVMKDGRLWKSDRRSQAVILFAKPGITVKVNSKGRLIVRGMTGRYHDHGYDLALEGVTTRAAREPGHTPVVSTIGMLPAVVDISTMQQMFASAM